MVLIISRKQKCNMNDAINYQHTMSQIKKYTTYHLTRIVDVKGLEGDGQKKEEHKVNNKGNHNNDTKIK